MKKTRLLKFYTVLFLCLLATHNAYSIFSGNISGFVENKGQITDLDGRLADEVLFVNQLQPNFYVIITNSGLSYITYKPSIETSATNKLNPSLPNTPSITSTDWTRTDVTLLNSSITKTNISKETPSTAFNNYYVGGISITGVYSYQSILIKNIYPNIDWKIYINKKQELKYDFIIHPGADPSKIKMKYEGAELNVTNQQLIFSNDLCKVSEGQLYTYNQNTLAPINSKYFLNQNVVSFNLSTYNKTETIVIDPPLELIWATYFGGTEATYEYDFANSIGTDSKDNVYICGTTLSTAATFPLKNPNKGNYYKGTNAGGYGDAYIAKFDKYNRLLWSTYYGGGSGDLFIDLCFDNSDNLFVVGYSSSPTKTGNKIALVNPGGGAYYNDTYYGGTFAVATKFDSLGVLKWGTVYGGLNDVVTPFTCTSDNEGSLYIAGICNKNAFPTVPSKSPTAFYQSTPGDNTATEDDAFVMKFGPTQALEWATYYGGIGRDQALDICSDKNNNIYVVGSTSSTSGCYTYAPTSGGTPFFSATPKSSFVLGFDKDLNPRWVTYYGGPNGLERIKGVTCDSKNNIILTGSSAGDEFPKPSSYPAGSYNQPYAGYTDMFITKLNSKFEVKWGTNLGGPKGSENGYRVVTDKIDEIFVMGTEEAWAPDVGDCPLYDPGNNAFYQSAWGGGQVDFILAMFDSVGVRKWTTFYGGSGRDDRQQQYPYAGVCINKQNNFYVTSCTQSPNNTLKDPANGAYKQTYKGQTSDNMILRFGEQIKVNSVQSNNTCYKDSTASATANTTGGNSPYTYSWSTTPVQTTQTATGLNAGTYTVEVYDATGLSNIDTVLIKGPTQIKLTTSNTNAQCGSNNGAAQVLVSGGSPVYTYSWNTGATANSISNLSQGSYTVTITDSKGCTQDTTIFINGILNSAVTITPTSTNCKDDSTGTAHATLNPGGTFNYTWSTSPPQTDSIATGLSAGTYSVIISDANNCSTLQTVTISEPSALTTTTSSTPAACIGSNGSATVVPAGSNGNFTFSWNITPTQTTATASGLPIGNYSVTITDSKGCTIDTTVTVSASNNNLTFTSTLTHVYCPTDTNGTANVTISQGQQPITYNWSNGDTTKAIGGLTQGTYSLTVTDANGCTIDTNITINIIGTPISITAIYDSLSCPNDSDAIATVSISNAQGATTYLWSTGAVIGSISGLSAGSYSVVVTDSKGCSDSDIFTIDAPSASYIDAGIDQVIESGNSVTLDPAGGNTYTWSPTENLSCSICENPVASPTVTTMYILNGTSMNGCIVSDSVLITVEPKCNGDVFIPSAFSPNNDLNNDVLYLRANCITTLDFRLYNRWGEKVFETNDFTQGWDGKFRGKMCDSGVFVYYINATTEKGETINKKGNVTLVR